MTTIPAGAHGLMDLIGHAETGADDERGYNTIFGHRETRLTKKLIAFTLDELLAAQKLWAKNWGGSAAGRYQVIRKTLLGLMEEMGLAGSTLFSPDTQDRMAFVLLRRRGYEDYVGGKITGVEFARRLAMEWASFPVLSPTQGAHRALTRGMSYYAGDGVNKALISPTDVENALLIAKMAPSVPVAAPKPAPATIPPKPVVPPLQPAPVAKLSLWEWLVNTFNRKDLR